MFLGLVEISESSCGTRIHGCLILRQTDTAAVIEVVTDSDI